MKKSTIITLISSFVLLILGAIIFTCGIFKSGDELVSNVYDFSESEINNFDIDLETSDLFFILSSDDKNKVVVNEREESKHTVSHENGTLMINESNNWHENIFSFYFKTQSIYVYLRNDSFDELKIKITTGDINIPNNFTFNKTEVDSTTGNIFFKAITTNQASFVATTGKISIGNINSKDLSARTTTGDIELFNFIIENNIEINASTGDVELNDVKSNNLKIVTTTGDVELNNTIINGNTTIQTSTGYVELKNSDSNTFNIKTTTGDVKGSLLSSKSFDVTTATGDVIIPELSTGGLCKIETSTGDVEIIIK